MSAFLYRDTLLDMLLSVDSVEVTDSQRSNRQLLQHSSTNSQPNKLDHAHGKLSSSSSALRASLISLFALVSMKPSVLARKPMVVSNYSNAFRLSNQFVRTAYFNYKINLHRSAWRGCFNFPTSCEVMSSGGTLAITGKNRETSRIQGNTTDFY